MINIGLVSAAMTALDEADRLEISACELAFVLFENCDGSDEFDEDFNENEIFNEILTVFLARTREHYAELKELQERTCGDVHRIADFKKGLRKRFKVVK